MARITGLLLLMHGITLTMVTTITGTIPFMTHTGTMAGLTLSVSLTVIHGITAGVETTCTSTVRIVVTTLITVMVPVLRQAGIGIAIATQAL